MRSTRPNSPSAWSVSKRRRRATRKRRRSKTMRASHKKRIARLVAALDAAEAAARDRRWELRVLDCICKDIRAAMEWRGIDPASSRVLLDEEAKLVGFVDTPELLAADLDFEDDADEEDPAGGEDSPGDDDARPLLDREADRLGKPFLDGARPDFKRGSLDQLWGWAVTQYSLVPAMPYDFAAGRVRPHDGAASSS